MQQKTHQISAVKGIKFTSREIDIIAAIIHNRSDKKISQILSISPRTVSTHVHNIMLKASVNSKDSIIDLVQESGMSSEFRIHYQHMLKQALYEKFLSKIKASISNKELVFSISLNQELEMHDFIEDIKGIGIKIKIGSVNKMLDQGKTDSREYDYYASNVLLLQKIIDDKNQKHIFEDFFIEYRSFDSNDKEQKVTANIEGFTINPKIIIAFVLALFTISYILYFTLFKSDHYTIRQKPTKLPPKHEIIERHSLRNQIDELFKEGSVVMIAGEHGAGKSVLARLYMESQNDKVIWEIDCTSEDSIIDSFEELAYLLARDQNDRGNLEFTQKITKKNIKKHRILSFITEKLNQYPSWILHFNNVGDISNIAEYKLDHGLFNSRSNQKEKIIITISDAEEIYEQFPTQKIIRIGSLNTNEKKELFSKIVAGDEIVGKELDKLPSFPYDIQLVASYIKSYKVSLESYIKSLDQDLGVPIDITLEDINKSTYSKMRVQIVSTSIGKILSMDSNYMPLLVLINSVSSNNISKNLLKSIMKQSILKNFMREVKSVRLIERNMKEKFSIHYTTQLIGLDYLKNQPNYEASVKKLITALTNYCRSELNMNHIESVKEILPHIKVFLSKIGELEIDSKAELYEILHDGYFDLGDYRNAASSLKFAIDIYKKNYDQNTLQIAKLYKEYGKLYRNQGNNKKAEEYFDKSLGIYKNAEGDKSYEIADLKLNLGSIYRNKHAYDKAYEYTKEGSDMFEQITPIDDKKIAKAESYLGSVLSNMGDQEQARILLERALAKYENHYKSNHTKTAWVKMRLAILYRKLGLLDKALDLAEQSQAAYRIYPGENSMEYAWSLTHLGIIHKERGEHAKMNSLIKEAISIFKNHLSEDHESIDWAKSHLD